MATLVKGKDEVEVHHPVDVTGWLASGWELKADKADKKPRDILIDRATELGLEFESNISNKDLKALIDAKELELKD